MSVETDGRIPLARSDCFDRLRSSRFGDEVTCPYCDSGAVETTSRTAKGARQYRCSRCDRIFNDLTGTIFANRRLELEEMFYIIENVATESTSELARELDRDRRAVRRFEHELQQLFPTKWFESAPESLAEPVFA